MSSAPRRPPMVAGNWKMHTTVAEGLALARAVVERCGGQDAVEVAVLPPFVHLWPVRGVLEGTRILLGAQDVYWADAGAFTGEVSSPMLSGWCDLVLVGHSERRHLFGETDEDTARKVAAARRHHLRVILAVGETATERDAGQTFAVIDRQLGAVLAGADPPPRADEWVIAYEPVWAIGTGRTATTAQAEEVCAHIRAMVAERAGTPPRVLYGGSVTADNAAELFGCAAVDGGLIGGASLKPDTFGSIVAAAVGASR